MNSEKSFTIPAILGVFATLLTDWGILKLYYSLRPNLTDVFNPLAIIPLESALGIAFFFLNIVIVMLYYKLFNKMNSRIFGE